MLLPGHLHELKVTSGISQAIIERRGYRSVTAQEVAALGFAPSQCRDGLALPQWTLAGAQKGWLLKPDEPRTNEDGKVLKYEAPAGSVPHFDVHPDALLELKDPTVPLSFTEGNKKADALLSRGVPCISVTGVWMFVRNRLVVPDLDEIALDGRRVRVIYDSDVMRKGSVADALLRLCAALDRRGAKVEVVYLPEGPNGEKVGLDDFFVAGGTVEELDAMTRPWDPSTGPGIWISTGEDETDIGKVRRERDQAKRDVSVMVAAIMNPEVSRNMLIAIVSTITETLARAQQGKAEGNGKVVLSAAQIADDWRPAAAHGERVEPLNPNGARPRLARKTVNTVLAHAVEEGLLPAKPVVTARTTADGGRYKTTDWVVVPPRTLADGLQPLVRYHAQEPTARKPRTLTPPCPSCGEVHAIHQVDYCAGCGATLDNRIIEPVVEECRDNLSREKDDASGIHDSLSVEAITPAPLRIVDDFIPTTRIDAEEMSRIDSMRRDILSRQGKPGHVNGWAAKGLDEALARIREERANGPVA